MEKLVHKVHVWVVRLVGLNERLYDAYGSRFEHQGQTFWDCVYYRAMKIVESISAWCKKRLHTCWCGNEADEYACACTDASW